MEKNKDKQNLEDSREIRQTGSVAQYSNSSFFKKKDEKAKKFLKKHPVPGAFWE